jgi:hypothetical protein
MIVVSLEKTFPLAPHETYRYLLNGLHLEKFGRRKTLLVSLSSLFGISPRNNFEGRRFADYGLLRCGIMAFGTLSPTIPVCISELARQSERARFVEILWLGCRCLVNWIGYTCSFASGGQFISTLVFCLKV